VQFQIKIFAGNSYGHKCWKTGKMKCYFIPLTILMLVHDLCLCLYQSMMLYFECKVTCFNIPKEHWHYLISNRYCLTSKKRCTVKNPKQNSAILRSDAILNLNLAGNSSLHECIGTGMIWYSEF